MTEPLVSIIIPCYNAEKYVGEAIESALAQTYPHVEVIVIDDGSTDGSLDGIRSFGERIRWESGPNRGGCAARNRGLEIAQGDFIQFLDADDYLHPQKLERQMPVAQESEAISFCDFVVRDADSGRFLHVPRRTTAPNSDPVIFTLGAERLSTPAPLHRRKTLLEVGGFDPTLPCAQEYDLHLRLACAGYRFEHFSEVLFTNRLCGGSVSSRYERILEQHGKIFARAVDVLRQRNELNDERRRAFAGQLAKDARNYLRLGLTAKARACFKNARDLHASGGIDVAYSHSTRMLRSIVGSTITERLVTRKRGYGRRRAVDYAGDHVLQG